MSEQFSYFGSECEVGKRKLMAYSSAITDTPILLGLIWAPKVHHVSAVVLKMFYIAPIEDN